MRKFLAVLLVFSFAAYAPLAECAAQLDSVAAGAGEFPAPPAAVPAVQYDGDVGGYFSPEQLDNLLAPIALYPDPLLAQVLLAATFPDQIDEADREMRASYDHYNVDYAPWDVSVKAVAHYPAVLHMMADKLDWTTSLGQAYVSQSTDVMAAVQRLRRRSRDAGYLVTTRQMEVVETDGYIYVAQPRYIYVPVYDPAVVFVPRRGFFFDAVIGFGTGFIIGAWLNHDCDWREHRVFYHGWDRDDGWERRSRPFVQINNVYVNRTYVNVTVNQTVINNTVNYTTLNRYNAVHRDVHYDDVRTRRGPGGVPDNGAGRPDDRGRGRDDRVNPGNTGNQGRGNGAAQPDDRGRGQDNRVNPGNNGNQGRGNGGGNNKIIDRNINTRDPRIDAYRGHVPVTGMPQRGEDVRTDRPGQIPGTPMPPRRKCASRSESHERESTATPAASAEPLHLPTGAASPRPAEYFGVRRRPRANQHERCQPARSKQPERDEQTVRSAAEPRRWEIWRRRER